MEKTRRIAYLLLVAGIMMLAMPAIPHHHHQNGLPCMKNDMTSECCGHSSAQDKNHACNGTACVAMQGLTEINTAKSHTAAPDIASTDILFFLTVTAMPQAAAYTQAQPHNLYIESLHDRHTVHAAGRRAPPCQQA